jgi:hypothetical protein
VAFPGPNCTVDASTLVASNAGVVRIATGITPLPRTLIVLSTSIVPVATGGGVVTDVKARPCRNCDALPAMVGFVTTAPLFVSTV